MTPQHGWFYTYRLALLLLLSSTASSSTPATPSTPSPPGSDGKPFSIVLYAKAAKSLNGKAVQAKDSDQQQRARQQPHSVGPLSPSPFKGALSAAGYTMVGPVPGGLRFTKPGDDAVVADAGDENNKDRSAGEGAKEGGGGRGWCCGDERRRRRRTPGVGPRAPRAPRQPQGARTQHGEAPQRPGAQRGR